MRFIFSRMLLWIPLTLSSLTCLAASTLTVVSAGVQPLTVAEALSDYHESGETETFLCIHIPAEKNNKPQKFASPVAVETDERIYLRMGGELLSAKRISSDEKHSRYLSNTVKVDVYIKKAMNPSEYGETTDRLMRLIAVRDGKTFSLKTFGVACGI